MACRQVCGYLYQPAVHSTAQYMDNTSGDILLDQLGHTWAEFYLPQVGWLPLDPTFVYTYTENGVTTKYVNWSTFANVSTANRYICLHLGDTTQDQLRVNYTGSRLEVFASTCVLKALSVWFCAATISMKSP